MAEESTAPSWSCSVATAPKDAGGFTVGEVFQLTCEGPSVALKEPLRVQLPDVMAAAKDGKPPVKDPNVKYKLVLLKPLNVTDNKLEYQATGYIPGEMDLKSFKIVDAENKEILVPQVTFKVQSVIDPNQQPKPEPFGPIGPLRMEWPVWIFFAALVTLLVLIGWGIVFFRRWVQKKNLERNIKKYLSPMGSYHQYNKDLRLLKQGVVFTSHQSWAEAEIKQYMVQLEDHFKMFLLREFIIPAKSWSKSLIVKNIQLKDKKGFPTYQKNLLRALTELDKYKEAPETLKPRDCEQITLFCAQAVDSIWSAKKHRSEKPQTASAT